MKDRRYLCIDLKSFFASVECVERGLDPMTTNLVVADPERGDKTICLAVSPSMKALGVRNRCRVFEIPLSIPYIKAEPRMRKYIEYAANIYAVYLTFVSPDDIHVYSIDEAFLDVTEYLPLYRLSAKELAVKIMDEIHEKVGVRATCGIGTNLYLAKIALDITAKHAADFIGELDEDSYRQTMWTHRPLTDFWRVGRGTQERLASLGIHTMADIAQTPEDILYRAFGVDAELLIDHAWGREPTTIADIKAYHAKTRCLSSGQVLMRDYNFSEGELIVKEMTDNLCLEMLDKGVATSSLTLFTGYSNALHLTPARGTASLVTASNDPAVLLPAMTALYRRTVDPDYPVRRFNITCNNLTADGGARQLSFFADHAKSEQNRKLQQTVLAIKKKYGKNSIFKGMDLQEAATGRERNRQIGGHKSGET